MLGLLQHMLLCCSLHASSLLPTVHAAMPSLYAELPCQCQSQSEEEWERARDTTVQQQAAAAHAEACAHPLPNLLALERRLGALLDKAMPVRRQHGRTAVCSCARCGFAVQLCCTVAPHDGTFQWHVQRCLGRARLADGQIMNARGC